MMLRETQPEVVAILALPYMHLRGAFAPVLCPHQ